MFLLKLVGFIYLNNKEGTVNTKDVIEKEIQYGLDKVMCCKDNESVYSYIRGYLDKYSYKYKDYPQIKTTLLKMKEDGCCESFMLSMLVDIYEEECDKYKACDTIDELVKVDFIRKKYWLWRKAQIN